MRDIFVVLASVALIGAYLTYIRAMIRGEVPHPVTIGIWTVWVVLNALTYKDVASHAARVFTLVQCVCMFTMAILVVRAIDRAGWATIIERTMLNRWDVLVGVAVVVALLYKVFVADPKTANTITQIAVLVSFIPMTKMAWSGRQRMTHWPWSLGVLAYSFQFIVAWPDGFAALVYPVVNIVGHGVVCYGVIRR
jgi:hypothetical protein